MLSVGDKRAPVATGIVPCDSNSASLTQPGIPILLPQAIVFIRLFLLAVGRQDVHGLNVEP